jgi:NAD(P)H-hydrate epimerase
MTEIILDHQKVLDLLPERNPYAHKGAFGKVLLLCGSVGYTGAAYLAAMGALRSGAGLVYLGVPESIYGIEATKLNEAIVFPLPEENGMLCAKALPKITELLPKMDAVLIGCGMGLSQGTLEVLSAILESAECPVVVDADGINLLSKHKSLLRGRKGSTVLTPHDGEFARLMGKMPSEDRTVAAADAANEMGCVMLLKGHETRISDGTVCYRNRTGNPGMAVGGSGDLLAGIIVSLIGQGMSAITATAVAAWLHGAAGDRCAQELGQYGMLPTDMLLALPRLMK